MSNTQKLFYERPRMEEVEARIIARAETASGPIFELDRTVFYPEGGGQPCDLGFLDAVPLRSVEESEGRIWHHPAADLDWQEGRLLRLKLDGSRRRDHTEQHSAQHLISGLFMRLFEAQTMSFHLGEERSTIDLSIPEPSEDELELVEREANRVIAEDYPYVIHLCPPESLDDLPLRKRPPHGEEVIRVVEIDGLDYSPCCGTHVASAAELRVIKLLSAERYKGMTRLAFVAGGRALEDYRRVYRSAKNAGKILSAPLYALDLEAQRCLERLKDVQAAQGELRKELAAREAELAILESSDSTIIRRMADKKASDAEELARAIASRGRTALILSLADLTLAAAAPDAGAALALRLKPLAAARGAKGGGGAQNFRACFPGSDAAEAFLKEAFDICENHNYDGPKETI